MATQAIELTATEWTEIGEGPLLVETNRGEDAFIHFGDSAPTLETTARHRMFGPASFSYSGTLKCFARANSTATIIVTEAV